MRRLVAFLASAYLLLFVADGALTVVDDGTALLLHAAPVHTLRETLAWVVLLLSLPLVAFMAATVLLPRRIFLPLALYPLLLFALSVVVLIPMDTGLSPEEISRFDAAAMAEKAPGVLVGSGALGLLQLLLGLAAVRAARRRSGEGTWLLSPAGLGPRAFCWRNSLGFLAAGGLVVTVVVPAYLMLVVGLTVDQLAGGFVVLRPTGLDVVARTYRRGEDRVWLVPMVHLGRPAFYRQVRDLLPGSDAVFLTEGVSDRGGRIRQKTDYGKFAGLMGLETQSEHFRLEGGQTHDQRSDVDAAAFSEATVAFLELIGRINEGAVTPADWGALRELGRDEETFRHLRRDLHTARVAHLMQEVDRWLPEYSNVVIPWGAGHMPDIAREVRARGFELESSRVLPVFRLGDALSGKEDRPAGSRAQAGAGGS